MIQDTHQDVSRLRQGRVIIRPRKNNNIKNKEYRYFSIQKLSDVDCPPLEFLQSLTHTIGNIKYKIFVSQIILNILKMYMIKSTPKVNVLHAECLVQLGL